MKNIFVIVAFLFVAPFAQAQTRSLGDASTTNAVIQASTEVQIVAPTVTIGGSTSIDMEGPLTTDDNITLANTKDLLCATDDGCDIGASGTEFQAAFFDGTVTTDVLAVDETSTFTGVATFTAVPVFSDDIDLETTGKTLVLEDGTAASTCIGTATANGTTAVTTATTCVVTGDYIFISANAADVNTANCWATNIVTGTSFDLDCDAATTTTFNWFIVHGE